MLSAIIYFIIILNVLLYIENSKDFLFIFKDHVRPIVNPAFTDVVRDRRAREGVVGVVEFHTYDDMRYAIRKLDGSRFENVFDRGFSIRCKEEGDGYSRSR